MKLSKLQKSIIFTSVFTAGVSAFLLKSIIAFGCILFVSAILGCIKKHLSIKTAIAILIIFFSAYYYTDFRTPKPNMLYSIAPTQVELQGHVISLPRSTSNPDTSKFEFIIEQYKQPNTTIWQNTNTKTLLYLKNTENSSMPVAIGDNLNITATIKKPYQATNPSEFDYSEYLKNKNIFITSFSETKDIKNIEKPTKITWAFLQKCNSITENIVKEHSKNLKQPLPELLSSIVFGKTAIDISDNIIKDFTSSGLIHLLAASGLNVALIYGIWLFIMRRFNAPFKSTVISGLILTLIYSVMTGLPPSIQRAEIMLCFILIGKLFNRQADNLALISLVCALLLIINPYNATDVGFQLSFAVSLGLIVCMPALSEKISASFPKVPDYLTGAIFVPIVAQLWASPIIIYHFNTFAIYSVIANILVVPFIGILSFIGFISSIFSLIPIIGSYICLWADKLLEPLLNLLLMVSNYFSSQPDAIKHLPSPTIAGLLITYALILFLTAQIKNNFEKKWLNYISIGLIAALTFITFYKPHTEELRVMFFDVGEGDSILITTPLNKTFLIDTGRTGFNGYSKAKSAIIPYLRKKGIESIDGLILTHPDSDHIGGALSILQDFRVQKVYNNGVKDHITETYTNTINYINKNHINYSEVQNGEIIYREKDLKITAFKVAEKYTIKHKKKVSNRKKHKKKRTDFQFKNIDFEYSIKEEDLIETPKDEQKAKIKLIEETYAQEVLKNIQSQNEQDTNEKHARQMSEKSIIHAFLQDLENAYKLEDKTKHTEKWISEKNLVQVQKKYETTRAKKHKFSSKNKKRHKEKTHKKKTLKHKKKDNESCILLLVEYKNTKFLLMSDAESSVLKK